MTDQRSQCPVLKPNKLAIRRVGVLYENMTQVKWRHFPSHSYPIPECLAVVDAFLVNEARLVLSEEGKLISDEVLSIIRDELLKSGFRVEASKKQSDKIIEVVTWGENGVPDKTFNIDALHHEKGIVVEIEAGQAVVNYRFLKDFFEACALQVAQYLVIAVRNDYKGNKDFDTVCNYFERLYASGRMTVPLKGLLVIGYPAK